MKNYLLWLVPAVAGLMLIQATKHVYTHSQPITRLQPPRTPPRTAFAHSIAATGILEPSSQNIAIGSALTGVVIEVYVPVERVGTCVKAGDPLFHVDDRHLHAQLELARTRAAASRAQLLKLERLPRPEDVPPSEAKVQAARANADRTLDEYERTRALLARRAASEEETVGKRLRYEEAAPTATPGRA